MADLLLTDPPYNVDIQVTDMADAKARNRRTDGLGVKNDSMSDEDFRAFLVRAFTAAASAMKSGASFYIWHADSEGLNFRAAAKESGLETRQCIIWNKQAMVMGRQDYQWKHEPCLYGWKEGSAHSWYSDRKQTTVLSFDRPSASAEHPTMKPVDLFSYQIENSAKGGDIVLDTFLGSGTTLVACEKLGRACYGVELDPHYCDVIVARYRQWCADNGREATIKRNGEVVDA
jgi:DNA modification methylase